MLTVMNALSQPLFKGFRFLSGVKGAANIITGVGIFEWETLDDIETDFMQGEFVVTTLSCARNDVGYACECLKALIDKKVAAIAIKNIYFSELPQEILRYSDNAQVPIFSFSDANFEDLIFNIKNAIELGGLNKEWNRAVENLIRGKGKPKKLSELARELNPFFYKHHICASCVMRDNSTKILEQVSFEYSNMSHKLPSFERAVFMLIERRNNLLAIYSSAINENLKREILRLLSDVGINQDKFRIGLSSIKHELHMMGTSIKESFYAAITCRINGEQLLEFEKIGLNRFLCPLRNSDWIKEFYSDYLSKLEEYDNKNKSNLLETLLTYVACGGNVAATAKQMYQHSNTIRYRLEKIRGLLGLGDSINSYTNLYVFAILYDIYKNFDV
ncbi:MAG: hypothetical protein GX222_06525 [Ruminococcaceae bacterium]|nr:hypothetical protein [Oscillospiraceae bacterium]